MAALRTQIYLSDEQRTALDRVRARRGQSLAGVIREAVDEYLERGELDPDLALQQTFGAVRSASAPSRAEWTPREQRRIDD